MKILIVGGGVAGPALAGLLKDHADITLVDKAPKWGDIGYAIALWGNGRRILDELGAGHDIRQEGYEIPWNVFEDKEGNLLKQFTFQVFRPYGPTIVVTRTTLHRALIKSLGESVKVRLGVTLKDITQNSSGVQVAFSDDSSERFDLVVGADGIHSQVRSLVFGEGYLKPFGWTAFAFWTPKGFGSPRGALEIASDGKMYFIYPMEDRAVVLLAVNDSITIANSSEGRLQQLHELFRDFTVPVGHMIDAIEDPAHIFHDSLSYVDMPEWYRGRVVLLGDAQHATSPLTGMGASMALEDAYVLADELKKISSKDKVSEALEKYARRRTKRIRAFHRASHIIEHWLMVKSPFWGMVRDIVIRVVPATYFTRPIVNLLKKEI